MRLLRNKLKLGHTFETKALEYLQGQGLKLIERNFRAKCGEIDLIMLDREEILFIEVKYRSSEGYGSASEAVTSSKKAKLFKTAQVWLAKNNKSPHHSYFRFDVITVTGTEHQIEWIQNALTEG